MPNYPYSISCQECNQPFDIKNSSQKSQLFCGRSCAAAYSNRQKPPRPSRYPFERCCVECGNNFVVRSKVENPKKFCNSSCAAKYNNQRMDKKFRDKQAISLRGGAKNCLICGEEFQIGGQTVCSIECRSEQLKRYGQAKSEKLKILRQKMIEQYGSDYWYKLGLRAGKASAAKQIKRSKDEISLYEMCSEYYQNVDHNIQLVDGWDADIIIHDTKTAILWNGPWHYREMPGLKHSLKQVQNRDRIKTKLLTDAGWKVMIFEDRYYTPKSAFEVIKGALDI